MPEYLDIVVHAAQETEPHRGDDHQYEIDVAQTAQQEYGYEQRNDDDDAAHGGHANLVNAEGVYLGVALRLCYLLAFQ